MDSKIIKDLESNKSINDVESLYEIQKITDKKEQVKIYFDFIAKKIDRKGLRESNRLSKGRLTPKVGYIYTGRAKKVRVEFDTMRLTDAEVLTIKNELDEVLKRYFPR